MKRHHQPPESHIRQPRLSEGDERVAAVVAVILDRPIEEVAETIVGAHNGDREDQQILRHWRRAIGRLVLAALKEEPPPPATA